MPLSLGVKAGSKIQVGQSVLEVKDMKPPCLIILSINGGPDIVVSDQSKEEILPKVFVFTGVSSGGSGNRLAIEAPKSISITRLDTR